MFQMPGGNHEHFSGCGEQQESTDFPHLCRRSADDRRDVRADLYQHHSSFADSGKLVGSFVAADGVVNFGVLHRIWPGLVAFCCFRLSGVP